MARTPTHSYTNTEQAWTFLAMLTADDRGSFYSVETRHRAKGHIPMGSFRRASLLEMAGDGRLPREDCYVRRNAMKGARSATTGDVRSVTGFLVDLDLHRTPSGSLESEKAALVSLIEDYVDGGSLPAPTMAVDTGRGLQLHYVLERSLSTMASDGAANSALLSFGEAVDAALRARFDSICMLHGSAENDASVKAVAGLCRVPGTRNSSSGTDARLLWVDQPWDLTALAGEVLGKDAAHTAAKPRRGRVRAFGPDDRRSLAESRMASIATLRDMREQDGNAHGSRNEMMFAFANAAFQAFGPEKAAAMAHGFNDGFSDPLPRTEVEATMRTLRRKGPYSFSNRRMMERLHMTEEEALALDMGHASKQARRAADKAANAARKEARKALVLSLHAEGLSLRAIADRTGCSHATVLRTVAAEKARKEARETLRRTLSSLKAKRTGWYIFCPYTLCMASGPEPQTPFRPVNGTDLHAPIAVEDGAVTAAWTHAGPHGGAIAACTRAVPSPKTAENGAPPCETPGGEGGACPDRRSNYMGFWNVSRIHAHKTGFSPRPGPQPFLAL